jgi:phage tail-like protein
MSSDAYGLERYLPALYRDDDFWARFLTPFGKVLSTGATVNGEAVPGFEATIDRVHRLFDPVETPDSFLPWLAAWVALPVREDWDEDTRRKLIQEVVPLYTLRGTRAGLEDLINLYLDATGPSSPAVTIVDPVPLQVGWISTVGKEEGASTVGVDTWVGGGGPHRFTVRVDFSGVALESVEVWPRAVAHLVDREKPAHTYYDLDVLIPTICVAARSTVGVDTALGNKLI